MCHCPAFRWHNAHLSDRGKWNQFTNILPIKLCLVYSQTMFRYIYKDMIIIIETVRLIGYLQTKNMVNILGFDSCGCWTPLGQLDIEPNNSASNCNSFYYILILWHHVATEYNSFVHLTLVRDRCGVIYIIYVPPKPFSYRTQICTGQILLILLTIVWKWVKSNDNPAHSPNNGMVENYSKCD